MSHGLEHVNRSQKGFKSPKKIQTIIDIFCFHILNLC